MSEPSEQVEVGPEPQFTENSSWVVECPCQPAGLSDKQSVSALSWFRTQPCRPSAVGVWVWLHRSGMVLGVGDTAQAACERAVVGALACWEAEHDESVPALDDVLDVLNGAPLRLDGQGCPPSIILRMLESVTPLDAHLEELKRLFDRQRDFEDVAAPVMSDREAA